MIFHCTAIDTSVNNSDLEDEPAAIPQHNDGNTSTHNNDGDDVNNDSDADANEDEDKQGNAVAGPTVLAHVEMAKTTRK